MINNQWYAVLSSHEVKLGQVVAARRFGEDVVFFRDDDGRLGCVTDLCAHRGASLGGGCVSDGHIQCPFHGIEYATDGRCVHIPSEGRNSKLDFSRFNLKHYEVREIGGIVFVWYGDGEAQGEPDVFDVVSDPAFSYDHMNDTWGVHYSRVIENQLDVSHLAFVHRTTIGRGNKTVANGPKVVWLDDNTLQTSANNEVDEGQTPKSADESVIKETNLNFKFPNLWLNHVSDKIMILAFFVPVDDEHSIIALRFYNRITGVRAIDTLIAQMGSVANKVIERQDKRVVETQQPKATSQYMSENLVAADLPIMEYRRRRHELQNVAQSIFDNTIIRKREEEHVMDNKAMYKLSYGLFVCTAVRGDKKNGCIINTAIQVASEPNIISFAMNKGNFTHDMIVETKKCNISVISEEAAFDLFKHFGFQSGRDVDKFSPEYPSSDYKTAENGIPYIVKGTNAYFSLNVKSTHDLGSHTLFICEPTAMEVLSDAGSCSYEYYQAEIKPRPQPAGTTSQGKTIWRCMICGYEWEGEELPDDFICPICKHPKDDFEKIVR